MKIEEYMEIYGRIRNLAEAGYINCLKVIDSDGKYEFNYSEHNSALNRLFMDMDGLVLDLATKSYEIDRKHN